MNQNGNNQIETPQIRAVTGSRLEPQIGGQALDKADQEPTGQKAIKSRESLRERVEQLNTIPATQRHHLEFSVHEATGRMIVKVVDRETEKLVRQFPPEELLSVAERLHAGSEILDTLKA